MQVGPVQPGSQNTWISKSAHILSDLGQKIASVFTKIFTAISATVSMAIRDIRAIQIKKYPPVVKGDLPEAAKEAILQSCQADKLAAESFFRGYLQKDTSYASLSHEIKTKGILEFVSEWFKQYTATKQTEHEILYLLLSQPDSFLSEDVLRGVLKNCSHLFDFSDEEKKQLFRALSFNPVVSIADNWTEQEKEIYTSREKKYQALMESYGMKL